MRIIHALFLLASASAIATSQAAPAAQGRTANPPFTLTISAFQSNSTVENVEEQVFKGRFGLRVRKTNKSDHNIRKWTELGFQYDIRDSSGNPVETIKSTQYLSSGEDMIVGEKGLGPGESKIIFPNLSSYKLDKPGTYTIQVSEHISNDPASDVVKSNVITVTVLPADSPPPAQ